jgi:hypothetical protein
MRLPVAPTKLVGAASVMALHAHPLCSAADVPQYVPHFDTKIIVAGNTTP